MEESTFDVVAWAPALARCGLNYQEPDQIRSSYLRLLMESGIPEEKVAAIAGIDVAIFLAAFGKYRINHGAYMDKLVSVA